MSRHAIERNQEIIDLRKAGKSAKEISEAFGISICRVYQICSAKKSTQAVADKPVKKDEKPLEEVIRETNIAFEKTNNGSFGSDLVREHENGMSIADIAAKYKLGVSTVRRILLNDLRTRTDQYKQKTEEVKEQKQVVENLRTYDKMKRLQWTIYDICTLVGVRIVGEYQLEDIVTGETYSATGARPTYAVTKNLN